MRLKEKLGFLQQLMQCLPLGSVGVLNSSFLPCARTSTSFTDISDYPSIITHHDELAWTVKRTHLYQSLECDRPGVRGLRSNKCLRDCDYRLIVQLFTNFIPCIRIPSCECTFSLLYSTVHSTSLHRRVSGLFLLRAPAAERPRGTVLPRPRLSSRHIDL